VGPQEYTLIKMKVLETPKALRYVYDSILNGFLIIILF